MVPVPVRYWYHTGTTVPDMVRHAVVLPDQYGTGTGSTIPVDSTVRYVVLLPYGSTGVHVRYVVWYLVPYGTVLVRYHTILGSYR